MRNSPSALASPTAKYEQNFKACWMKSAFETARREEQIQGHRFHRLLGETENLVAYYDCDASGTPYLKDHSGRGNDLRFSGLQVLEFDGETGYAQIPGSEAINFSAKQDFTLEIWSKIAAEVNQEFHLISKVETRQLSIGGGQFQFNTFWPYLLRVTKSGSLVVSRSDGNHVAQIESPRSLADGSFHHLAFVKCGAKLFLYIDGVAEGTTSDAITGDIYNTAPLYLAHPLGMAKFKGQLTEFRLWNVARSSAQIVENMNRRLRHKEDELVGYWPFNSIGAANRLEDVARGNCGRAENLHLVPEEVPLFMEQILSSAPISSETPMVRSALAGVRTDFHGVTISRPAVQEYSAIQTEVAGVIKRYYSYIDHGGWRLFTGFKVGEIELEWIGQAQYEPQLIGFIEGAPPIPSENLTPGDDHAAPYESAVELNENGNVLHSFSALPGAWKDPTHIQYSELGRRYLPPNTGLALVQSVTAEVFAWRLKHSEPDKCVIVAFRLQSNPDIPAERRAIIFRINPKYVKQGTLDGKIGLSADRDDYPHATDDDLDCSFCKPLEAYALKKRIEKEDLPKRNMFNMYAWTADHGLVAETQQRMSIKEEIYTGAFALRGPTGPFVEINSAIAKTKAIAELEALNGCHLYQELQKNKESEIPFGLAVDLRIVSDIYFKTEEQAGNEGKSGANGHPIKCPGKVDCYRFMTFYLQPDNKNFQDFKNKVVDREWLVQSSEANAVLLRHALQTTSVPWRVLHRVTFVSRVLPPLGANGITKTGETLRAANLETVWELIKRVQPYMRAKSANYSELRAAVHETIDKYTPELAPAKDEVVRYISLYYQVFP
jgi:hypothetical protein